MEKLTRDFFARDTVTVARELMGAILVRRCSGQLLMGRITETEAYIGRCDKACHAYGYRRTARTETLFAPPGHAYVYLIYGLHHCLNLVTEAEGEPAAVLLRGMEPIRGRDAMAKLRYQREYVRLTAGQKKNLANGPGKLCKAMDIDRTMNGMDLMGDTLYLLRDGFTPGNIHCGPRIGIDYAEEARDFPWRFWL